VGKEGHCTQSRRDVGVLRCRFSSSRLCKVWSRPLCAQSTDTLPTPVSFFLHPSFHYYNSTQVNQPPQLTSCTKEQTNKMVEELDTPRTICKSVRVVVVQCVERCCVKDDRPSAASGRSASLLVLRRYAEIAPHMQVRGGGEVVAFLVATLSCCQDGVLLATVLLMGRLPAFVVEAPRSLPSTLRAPWRKMAMV